MVGNSEEWENDSNRMKEWKAKWCRIFFFKSFVHDVRKGIHFVMVYQLFSIPFTAFLKDKIESKAGAYRDKQFKNVHVAVSYCE